MAKKKLNLNEPVFGSLKHALQGFRKAGIKTKVITRRDLGYNAVVLELSQDRKTLRILIPAFPNSRTSKKWVEFEEAFSGLQFAVPDIDPASKKAVLIVSEPQRSFTRKVRVKDRNGFWDDETSMPRDHRFRSQFPISLRTIDDVGNLINHEWIIKNHVRTKGVWQADVTVNAPPTKTCFFIGRDESHLFISCLPKTVYSVEKAYEVLTPNVVRRAIKKGLKVQRQGEFFFVPMTDAETKKAFEAGFEREPEVSGSLCQWEEKSEIGTDHIADLVMLYDTTQYALGGVYNKRHRTLFLRTLHRVVPNNEVLATGNSWD